MEKLVLIFFSLVRHTWQMVGQTNTLVNAGGQSQYLRGAPAYVHSLHPVAAAFVGLASAIMLTVGIYMLYTGLKVAKLFVFGWACTITSLIISAGWLSGLLPYNYFTINSIVLAITLSSMLFFLALVINVKSAVSQQTVRQNSGTAENKGPGFPKKLNFILQKRIDERTHELISSNKSLSVIIDNLKSTQIKLIETEKMASLGQLTAGVAHEINNPMNFISANVKPLRMDFEELFLLLDRYEQAANNPGHPELLHLANIYKRQVNADFIKEEIMGLLSGIEDGVNRSTEIIGSLRTFSRLDDLELKPANVNTAILNALIILRSYIPYYIEVKPVLDKFDPVYCYVGKINQIIINLVTNSIQAIKVKEKHNNESVLVITRNFAEHIAIEVVDTGIGMTAETRQRVFEPFFTTKNIGEGTGLGLSIVFGIVEQHQGSIQVESTYGVGTTFTVIIPKNLSQSYSSI